MLQLFIDNFALLHGQLAFFHQIIHQFLRLFKGIGRSADTCQKDILKNEFCHDIQLLFVPFQYYSGFFL